MSSVYFGGSRSSAHPLIPAVVSAVVSAGHSVHVGCQFGADQAVVNTCPPSDLTVFAVKCPYTVSNHIQCARVSGARVVFHAGGTSAPMPARYLLRSIAAFQGCAVAVFFNPGSGSLAVAREFVKYKTAQNIMPLVFAFQQEPPAPIPSTAGTWVPSSFHGFQCWQWQAPAQLALF